MTNPTDSKTQRDIAAFNAIAGFRTKQRLAAEDLERTLDNAKQEVALGLKSGMSTSILRSYLNQATYLLTDYEVNIACERAYLEAAKEGM